MASSSKIFTYCLWLLLSSCVLFVEGGRHGGSSDLATLIAAGLITLLLKEGASSARHSLGLARHALPLAMGHGYNVGSIGQLRSLEGLSMLQGYQFAPSFGGIRYNLGVLENSFPLGGFPLIPGFGMPLIGMNFGIKRPLNGMVNNKHEPLNNNINNFNNFDPIRDIIQRERDHNPPIQDEQNDPEFNPDDRDFFNFENEEKPPHSPHQQQDPQSPHGGHDSHAPHHPQHTPHDSHSSNGNRGPHASPYSQQPPQGPRDPYGPSHPQHPTHGPHAASHGPRGPHAPPHLPQHSSHDSPVPHGPPSGSHVKHLPQHPPAHSQPDPRSPHLPRTSQAPIKL